ERPSRRSNSGAIASAVTPSLLIRCAFGLDDHLVRDARLKAFIVLPAKLLTSCLRQDVLTPAPVRRGAADRDVALPVDGAARLRRATHRARHRCEDTSGGAALLSLQGDAVHPGRILRRRVSPGAQHGA